MFALDARQPGQRSAPAHAEERRLVAGVAAGLPDPPQGRRSKNQRGAGVAVEQEAGDGVLVIKQGHPREQQEDDDDQRLRFLRAFRDCTLLR